MSNIGQLASKPPLVGSVLQFPPSRFFLLLYLSLPLLHHRSKSFNHDIQRYARHSARSYISNSESSIFRINLFTLKLDFLPICYGRLHRRNMESWYQESSEHCRSDVVQREARIRAFASLSVLD